MNSWRCHPRCSSFALGSYLESRSVAAPRSTTCVLPGLAASCGSASVASNPSIERTSQRPLRALWSAAHVER